MAHEIKNILVNNIHDRMLKTYATTYIRGCLIDIGCGIKPYKKKLAAYVTKHVGIDHIDTLHDKTNIDIFGTAYNLPISTESFNLQFVLRY